MVNSQEIRHYYRVARPDRLIKNMATLGIEQSERLRVTDRWFAPQDIGSLEAYDEWFHEKRGMAWRIIREDDSRQSFIKLEYRHLTPSGELIKGPMTGLELVEFEPLLRRLAYANWLTIHKRLIRFRGQQSKIRVAMGRIDGLESVVGPYLELGCTAPTEDAEQAAARIGQFATNLKLKLTDKLDSTPFDAARVHLAAFGA